MLYSTVFLLCLAGALGAGYEGYRIYDLIAPNEDQRDFISDLFKQEDYDFFILSKLPDRPSRVMVSPENQNKFIQLLNHQKINYTVINPNVAQSVEQQFADIHSSKRSTTPRLTTDTYYSYDEITEYIEYLAQAYPSRVFLKVVGKTYQRRILKTITITNGDAISNKKVIFVDGGFHAREWISPAAVLYLIEQLVEKYDENKELLANYDWVILPVVNADGYEYTRSTTRDRLWRKTRSPHRDTSGYLCYGTDPNRNFDFKWMLIGASDDPCTQTFAGPEPFSEPETQVVRDLLYTVQDRCKFYLTIHSYGRYLIYPWSWTMELPATSADLNEIATAGYDAILKATGFEYTVGATTHVMYGAAGASDDWAYGVANIPISMTMELAGGGDNGFDPPTESIDPYVKEAWVGIRAMGLAVVNKY